MDDCFRFGIADCYYHNNSQNAASFVLKMVKEAPFPIRCFRTDNGSEFKKSFTKVCHDLGITIKRNPPKHPTSNGKVERMHRTIEEECFWEGTGSQRRSKLWQILVESIPCLVQYQKKTWGLWNERQNTPTKNRGLYSYKPANWPTTRCQRNPDTVHLRYVSVNIRH